MVNKENAYRRSVIRFIKEHWIIIAVSAVTTILMRVLLGLL